MLCVKLQLDQAAGTTILKLMVTDKDSTRNGPPFEFSILSGNEDRAFTIDQSGELRSSRVIGPEATREYTLEVQVRSLLGKNTAVYLFQLQLL